MDLPFSWENGARNAPVRVYIAKVLECREVLAMPKVLVANNSVLQSVRLLPELHHCSRYCTIDRPYNIHYAGRE